MSGGAGSSGAGSGPAGFDPVPAPTAPRDVRPPRAILFQLNGFDFPLDENGLYLEVDPTDQWVALQLGIVLGTVGTSATAGNTLRRITHVGAPSTQRQVEDAVRTALAPKVNAGAIAVRSVQYESKSFGGFKVQVDYENLLAKAEKARTITLNR